MSTPLEIVHQIERDAGTLNIYERDIAGEFSPDLVGRLRKERKEHFESINESDLQLQMDAQGYEDAIYRPRFIVVAREVAEPLMKDDWEKVEDILVAPPVWFVWLPRSFATSALPRCHPRLSSTASHVPTARSERPSWPFPASRSSGFSPPRGYPAS